MKKPLSKEILTDYLFELLEDSIRESVEEQLRECPQSQKLLNELKIKFKQLQFAEPEKPKHNKPQLVSIITCAAAAIIFIYFAQTPLLKHTLSAHASSKKTVAKASFSETRMFQLEFFSEKKDTFSLLSKLEAPLKQTIDLKIPKVRIEYDDENYVIVDLRTYQSLNLPSEFLEERQNNFEQFLSFK